VIDQPQKDLSGAPFVVISHAIFAAHLSLLPGFGIALQPKDVSTLAPGLKLQPLTSMQCAGVCFVPSVRSVLEIVHGDAAVCVCWSKASESLDGTAGTDVMFHICAGSVSLQGARLSDPPPPAVAI